MNCKRSKLTLRAVPHALDDGVVLLLAAQVPLHGLLLGPVQDGHPHPWELATSLNDSQWLWIAILEHPAGRNLQCV